MRQRARHWAAVLGCLACLGGCASSPPAQVVPEQGSDPFETSNRFVFAFNQMLDTIILQPAAVTYDRWVPEVFQNRIQDILRNFSMPLIIVNELLQGDWEDAEQATARFFINSTLGLGGLVDVANTNNRGIPYESEDFGQTLAVWGVPSGPYVVLPIFGPATVRDGAGIGAESLVDPINRINEFDSINNFQASRAAAFAVDTRARNLANLDELEQSSVDFYATIRSVYLQRRRAQILEGEGAAIDIPDIEDFDAPETDDNGDQAFGQPGSDAPASEGDGSVSMLPLELDLDPMDARQ